MYVGLLNCAALCVFGIAGITATLERAPAGREHRNATVAFRGFAAPADLTDAQVAAQVYRDLRIPLAAPLPNYAIHRNARNQLELSFYTVNGTRTVTVLEAERRLRIDSEERPGFWQFLNGVHTVTADGHPDARIRLWAWYNEFAIWSLMAMALSGLYLWLASRPRFRWAQISLTAGCGLFAALYFLTR